MDYDNGIVECYFPIISLRRTCDQQGKIHLPVPC